MFMPSYEQYIAVTAAVYACISSFYLHMPTMGWGDPCQYMSVYACIYVKNTCIYISQYMYVYPAEVLYVFPTVYLSVFLYVYPAVFLAVFFVHLHSVTVPSRCTRSRCRHGCFAFACAGARSLHLRRAVATASLSRGSARHIAKFNQIWSARQNSGSQRQLVEARAEVSLRAEVPRQSWLAVVHEVTAEQRRPSDVEKMRSLSNRQPLMRKRSRIFWNQLHTEIQAQKNQRSRLQSY